MARTVVERFVAACAGGDLDTLLAVLDPDTVGAFDSSGRIPGAPTAVQVGGHLVAATLLHAFAGSSAAFDVADVNAHPGVVVGLSWASHAVIFVETDGDRVGGIRAIGNRDSLANLNQL